MDNQNQNQNHNQNQNQNQNQIENQIENQKKGNFTVGINPLPRNADDFLGIKAYLALPYVIIRNVPRTAIARDVQRFVLSKSKVLIERVHCFRNEDMQPLGIWMVILKSRWDCEAVLRNSNWGDQQIGAQNPEIFPAHNINERFFKNYFLFEMGNASGRTVLFRGLTSRLQPDFVRNHLRSYDTLQEDRNIVFFARERQIAPYLLAKLANESEAQRLVRERDNTKFFLGVYDFISLSVLY